MNGYNREEMVLALATGFTAKEREQIQAFLTIITKLNNECTREQIDNIVIQLSVAWVDIKHIMKESPRPAIVKDFFKALAAKIAFEMDD